MKKSKIFVTVGGLKKLKEEYTELTEIKRPSVAERIKKAREHGDISENAEYDAAREEQAFLEGRIQELEEILRDVAVVQEDTKNQGKVIIGSKVRVRMEGAEEEYHIVGAVEADPNAKKISHESPLGLALLGKKVGDTVAYAAPVGKIKFHILEIK
ncbi:MAG: transcription elongation factor GreA [bacterium]